MFTKKNTLIIGAARSGIAAAKILKRLGASVILSDIKSEEEIEFNFDELRALDIKLSFGMQDERLLNNIELIIISPIVPIDIPLLQIALFKHIPIISEIELAYKLARSPICAVTGTNGKTTTVTLLGFLLSKKFSKVGVGGNIGKPLSEVAIEINDSGCIVAEISSYQLESTQNFKPHIAAILNVTPDHLKRHKTMENYQAVKEKIFAQETLEDFLVLNFDDYRTREMKERAHCKTIYFSRICELAEGAFIKDNFLVIRINNKIHKICACDELKIKGEHNIEDALAASMIAFLMGVKADDIRNGLKSFQGVEHRIEFVREINGVKYFNDSKATNPDSTIKALKTFKQNIILIAGGDDKLTDLTDFIKLIKTSVDQLILIGDASKRFKSLALDNNFPLEKIFCAGYSMRKAVEYAKRISHSPQIVLLSPACASFDMYKDFEERGRDFKKIVNHI